MAWKTHTYDLSAYAGKAIKFRWLYLTDGGVNQAGAFIDDIALTVGGQTTTDDVESGAGAWTAKGFTRMGGSITQQISHYYLAEYRRYSGYDGTLQPGPYNFGFLNTKENWVEHFPYQDGMLVWYVDNEYADNNVSAHPGHGAVLPVDAHPVVMKWADGALMSNRITPYDATFGTQATDAFTLHRNGVPVNVPSRPAVKVFDDTRLDELLRPGQQVRIGDHGRLRHQDLRAVAEQEPDEDQRLVRQVNVTDLH